MLSNKPLVNLVPIYSTGHCNDGHYKMKQLLNELSYLVMAMTANAFISPAHLCVSLGSFAGNLHS